MTQFNIDVEKLRSMVMHITLLTHSRYSYLPDLFDAINGDVDAMLKLLCALSGLTIKFPTISEIETSLRDVDIYIRIETTKVKNRDSVTDVLAKEYSAEHTTVIESYKKIKELLKEHGIFFVIK